MIRLYFNAHGAKPWSVDKGTIETEQSFESVRIGRHGTTHYNPDADNVKEPKAWIEFDEGSILIPGKTAYIVQIPHP